MKTNKISQPIRPVFRFVTLLTLVALLNLAIGCTTVTRLPVSEIKSQQIEVDSTGYEVINIQSVEMKDGEVIEFKYPRGKIASGSSTIVGISKAFNQERNWQPGDSIEVELQDVMQLTIREHSRTKTSLLTIGILSFALIAYIFVHDVSNFGK